VNLAEVQKQMRHQRVTTNVEAPSLITGQTKARMMNEELDCFSSSASLNGEDDMPARNISESAETLVGHQRRSVFGANILHKSLRGDENRVRSREWLLRPGSVEGRDSITQTRARAS